MKNRKALINAANLGATGRGEIEDMKRETRHLKVDKIYMLLDKGIGWGPIRFSAG